MKLSELKSIIKEEVKKVLKESTMNPLAFSKLFIQNVKNGLITKPTTFKELKDSIDYASNISGIPDMKKSHKKEYEEIIGHLAAHYDLKK